MEIIVKQSLYNGVLISKQCNSAVHKYMLLHTPERYIAFMITEPEGEVIVNT